MNSRPSRFDAPFWVAMVAGLVLVGSLGFLGLAAAAQDAAKGDSPPISLDDS